MSSTALPIASSGTSDAGTAACSSISVRSTTVTSGESNATFSPGWTCRLATDAGERRRGDGVAQRVAGELHLRFRRFDAALRHAEARLGIVVRVLRDEVLLQQRLVRRLRLGGHGELRLRRLERADALDELRLEVGGVDARQQLAGPDGLAFADRDLAHVARHLRLDGRLPDRLHRAGHRQPARQRLRLDPRQVRRREFEHDRAGRPCLRARRRPS